MVAHDTTTNQGAPAAPSLPKSRRQRRAWGTVIQRSGKPGFYARFTWEGTRYCRAGGPTKAVAAQKLSQAHAALSSGKPVPDVLAEVFGDTTARPLTFAEAWRDYLPHAKERKRETTYTRDVRRGDVLRRAPWASKRLEAVRPNEIQAWADSLRTAGASGPTVNRYVSLTSAVFRWALRRGHVRANPCSAVEKESEAGRGREVYLTRDEAAALLTRSPVTYRPLLVAAISTGMRAGELLGLCWRDVDLARREITVRADVAKTGRSRVVPMTDDLRLTLEQERASATPDLEGARSVFLNGGGEPITYPALRAAWVSLRRAMRGVLPEAKRRALRFHDLRHTAASLMVAVGVPLFDVSKILGHSGIQMTMRYAHFSPENARASVEKYGRALALFAGEAKAQQAV